MTHATSSWFHNPIALALTLVLVGALGVLVAIIQGAWRLLGPLDGEQDLVGDRAGARRVALIGAGGALCILMGLGFIVIYVLQVLRLFGLGAN
jgi:hypothetical protein